jgi:N-acetylneuraminic acid mutarotase
MNSALLKVFLVPILMIACVVELKAQSRAPISANITTWVWNAMGPLKEARELPRLAVREPGVIILIGGGSELRATATKSTETFDPSSRQWLAGPTLNVARRDAEVVTLLDGSVLAIGGSDGPTRTGVKSVERLDRGNSSWRIVSPMNDARIGHTAVMLPDGRVFVAGGQDAPDHYLKTAEIYDPVADRWSNAGEMLEERSVHSARPMKDGRVIVMGGGTDTSATSSVEIYDPKTNSWSQTGSLIEPRWGFASAVLDDGRILVAGGRVPAKKGATLPEDQMVLLRGAEMYEPKSGKWQRIAEMHQARSMGIPNVELIQTTNGGFLFPGGRSYPAPYDGVASAEQFDPRSSTWEMVSPMRSARSYFASLRLSDGKILVAGGRGPGFLPMTESECFEPTAK